MAGARATASLVAAATALTTLGTLPVFLLGAQAVYVRSDVGFGVGRFGLLVSAFFASAALAALLGGGLLDRLGRRNSTLLAGALVLTGGLGVGLLAHTWPVLLVLMVILGAANAACQVTANLILARAVPSERRGLGFGVKQAAIPLAITLAGLAVPLVGATVGWRWTFVATGTAGVLVLASGVRLAAPPPQVRDGGAGQDRPPLHALLVAMGAIALASAAVNSFGSFIALWSFRIGLSPSEAGLLMAAGSTANIAVRVFSGYRADLRHGRNLPIVALQMLVGALALLVLSAPSAWTLVPAAFAAFAIGWSWPGLLLFAVVRLGREAPGMASGVVQAGAFAGGAAGPVLFGLAVDAFGYPVAWRGAALVFLAAAALVVAARHLFRADLEARPPTTPLRYGGGKTAGPPDDR